VLKTCRSLILVINNILLGATVGLYIDRKNMHGMNYTTLPAPTHFFHFNVRYFGIKWSIISLC